MHALKLITLFIVLTCYVACGPVEGSTQTECAVGQDCAQHTCDLPPCGTDAVDASIDISPDQMDLSIAPDTDLAVRACEPGTSQCDVSGTQRITCSEAGQIITTPCSDGERCEAGLCTAQGCTLDTTQCMGDDV